MFFLLRAVLSLSLSLLYIYSLSLSPYIYMAVYKASWYEAACVHVPEIDWEREREKGTDRFSLLRAVLSLCYIYILSLSIYIYMAVYKASWYEAACVHVPEIDWGREREKGTDRHTHRDRERKPLSLSLPPPPPPNTHTRKIWTEIQTLLKCIIRLQATRSLSVKVV